MRFDFDYLDCHGIKVNRISLHRAKILDYYITLR